MKLPFRLLPFALLTAAAVAQGTETAADACGVSIVEGRVVGRGPSYAAHFDHGGLAFVPALGHRADRELPLRYTLTDVRRDGATLWSGEAAAAEPRVDAATVRYGRSAGLTEVYAVGGNGIEQSFVFAERPAGTGDLVVSGAIATELPLVAASDEGLRYERIGLGGVTFGAVTGIDANGVTVRGSIHADGSRVDYVLPAEFVDRAAYPLVLDPLIGSAFGVGSPGGSTAGPSVAFASTQNRYLVVWRHTVSATVAEVRAQLLLPTGAPIGGVVTLHSSTQLAGSPAVAYVRATNRFLVVWATSPSGSLSFGTVQMVSLAAAGGAPSATVTVASALLTTFDQPQVGGDSRPAGVANEYACVTYRRSTAGGEQIESRGVHVTAAANPILVGTVQVVASGNVAYSSLSKHAGSAGNWIAAWVHGNSSAGPFQNVSCRVIGAFGVPCSAVKDLAFGVASADVLATSCATADGNEFVVAWEDAVAGRVRVRPCTFAGPCPGSVAAHLLASPVVAAGVQQRPSIDFANGKYVLTWLHGSGPTTLYAKGLDPTTCKTCGAEHVLDTGTVYAPDVVARWSGGDAVSDAAMIVWADGAIRGQLFEAVGSGTVASMGGACGSTGFDDFNTYSSSPVLGNTDFELQLLSPSTPAVAMVLGLSEISIGCGPCTLVPAIDATVGGGTVVPLPIPCDVSWLGLQFTTQWLILKPGGCPDFPDFALSNALRFTVGE